MKNKLMKLSVENNWEHLIFKVENSPISQIKTIVIKVKNQIKKIKVEKTSRYRSVSDMGHSYDVNTVDYMIPLKNELGIKHKISLYELISKYKVKVFVEKNGFVNQEVSHEK